MMNDRPADRRKPLKHRVKIALRGTVANVSYYSGFSRMLARRSRQPRLTILAMHNVESPPSTDFLPPDMKTPAALFDRLVAILTKTFPTFTVDGGVRALRDGKLAGAAVAISLDDGYKDNLKAGLPILQKHGAKGTVYVEAGAVGERKLSWTHCYFWVLHHKGFEFFIEHYKTLSKDAAAIAQLEAEACAGGDLRYHLKRILKYKADINDRDATCEAVMRQAGGDPPAVAAQIYLSPDEVRELDRAGIEIGGHTISHPILARCADSDVEREIGDGRRRLESWLGHPITTFAYPWGRKWDYDDRAVGALAREGFVAGCSMDPGTNHPKSDTLQLRRYAVDSGVSIPDLVAEASGTFDFVRKYLKLPV
ncbi:MAG: polysaccharide deacetylase family protein [Planctomycetes bacterium]|nr:polysaccharide deacetylase family protein [Planctomycetota bacterium]